MSDSGPFLVVEQPCNEAIAWVTRQVGNAGLQVLRTFDLQNARENPGNRPCPRHGTGQCDCQMIVLLVYGENTRPISLVAHSCDGVTGFSLVDTPQQRVDARLERVIQQILPMD